MLGADPESIGLVVITNDLWNTHLSQVGFVAVRRTVRDIEQQYAAPTTAGFASAARVVSLVTPPDSSSAVGPATGMLSAHELADLEERLCSFLQLPEILSGQRTLRGPGGTYPLWSHIYYGPAIQGEAKRFVIVSPDPWNAVSGMATGVRTTSQVRYNDLEFPRIEGGAARACCGDTTTISAGRYDLRRRPHPSVLSADDMIAVARGLVSVYDLSAAARSLGIAPP